MSSAKPSLPQKIAYCFGRRLPDSMRDWVAHDLAGKGAIRRHLVRISIPVVLVLAPFWLIPTPPEQNWLYVHSEMTVPLLIWALVVAQAINKPWRRYRLAQHGLDPNMIDEIKRRKNAKIDEDYARRYGPRPESAEWQANSSPF